jgi:hypothetical protein
MSRPPHPLEPEPGDLEAQTRAVAELVLEQVRSFDRQPSFDLDGVEEVRASSESPSPRSVGPQGNLRASGKR